MKSMTRFIISKLKLRVNEQKSAVAEPWERKFLGFSFTSAKTPKRRIAPKAVIRFKERPGADESDARCEHRANGRGTGPLPTGLDRLLRPLRNAERAAKP